MKKIFLVAAIALMGATTVNAQSGNFKVGAHIGLPVSDLITTYTFNTGVDVSYTLNVSEHFNLGITTGYSYYFGKTIKISNTPFLEVPDLGIIPIAATGEYLFPSKIYLSTDLGYAFFTNTGANAYSGAFYYQPKIGYKFGASEGYVGYKRMSKDGGALSSINLGYAFTIGK
ncbi:MAG: hypothetical protein CSA38_00420 [Flavobacteriales bacterium]|nr:MAG: hypothetical protein CSA38_00420 [Flavobacteriales bacterium]